jgi:hypothetical protein
MVNKIPKQRKGLLKRLKESFSGLNKCEELVLMEAYVLQDSKVRMQGGEYMVQLNIGPDGKVLHIYPEWPIDQPREDVGVKRYIIFDPKSYYKACSGFLRINPGQQLVLGKGRVEQKDLLNLPQNIPRDYLSITNDKGNLVFKRIDVKATICISPLLKEKQLYRVNRWRRAKLNRLRLIFGGPIERLSSDTALKLIKQVNKVMKSEAYREEDNKGRPGGVVKLPSDVIPLLVGDLHTNVNNLLVILSQSCFLNMMKKGKAALIILGDAVHPESAGQLEEMDSSALIMDMIFKLKLWFPKQVFYIRGNHDSYSAEIGKQGIPQGLLWKRALEKTRGKAYVNEMAKFYERLPYIVYSDKFIACHAGPPTRATSRKHLINIRSHPKLAYDLTNVRIQRKGGFTGYSKKDVKKFRKYFGLNSEVSVIVGHTPLSTDDTVWEHPGDIENHYVIYGNHEKWVSVITVAGDGLYPLRYPVEHLTPLINGIKE